mgnify:CR=1 FL=1|tara:strand:- start:16084 stop:16698 length:615 start_codon:yes stop_codon:yes gene_type:complete
MKKNHYDFVVKSISELKPYESNSRLHSNDQITQIMKSISTFGFTNPVLIDELGGVIAGHGRLEAATRLELSEVPCVVITGLDQHKKAALVIADNRIAENASWNFDALKSELGFLNDVEFDLSLTGFDDDYLANIFETDIFGDGENDLEKDPSAPKKTDYGFCEFAVVMPVDDKAGLMKAINKIKADNNLNANYEALLYLAKNYD